MSDNYRTDENNKQSNNIYIKLDEEPKKEKKKKKKIVRKLLLIIFICLFLFSSINLIRWVIYNKQVLKLSVKFKEENFSEETDLINIENKFNENKSFKNPVNFEELKKINDDCIAWIKIEGTNIDYPIVQTDNNEYYLHRDINKKFNTCGWIFLDYKNTSSFIDKNTVVFGHNIKSGIMFSDLQKILNNEVENAIITIYTENDKLEYKVYSSYLEQPEDYAIKSNLVEEDDVATYIKEMIKRSQNSYNIVPNKTDRLITLSTCDKSGKNRILVHGVYISGQKYER